MGPVVSFKLVYDRENGKPKGMILLFFLHAYVNRYIFIYLYQAKESWELKNMKHYLLDFSLSLFIHYSVG